MALDRPISNKNPVSTEASIVSLSFSGKDGFLLDPTNGPLFVTHDAGASWQMLGAHPNFISVLALAGNRALAVSTPDSQLYFSGDGGKSWRPVPVTSAGNTLGVNQLAASDANHIWVSTNQGLVMRTADGGKSWTAIRFRSSFVSSGLSFISPRIGFCSAAGPVGNAFLSPLITRDGGRTWYPLPQRGIPFY